MHRARSLALLLACALGAALIAPRPAPRPDLGERDEARHEPNDWFWAQRAFPSGAIDQDALLATIDDAKLARERLHTSVGLSWQPAGPYNIGGRVTALAVVAGGTTVYLGSANGGVFRSDDGGVHWTSIFDRDFGFSIGALALDPNDAQTVYCGTGEANSAVDTYDGAGLYRTRDGGQSWESLGLIATRRIARVAIDPANTQRIFVAAMGTQFSTNPDRGLYRSEDGGASWSKVLFVTDSTGCCDVAINPAHPETVYCATWERVRHPTYRRAYGPECGIWISADHGATWTRLANGLPAPSDDVGRIALAIAPSRPSTVYAQIVSGAALGYVGLGCYRTLDGGATWTRRDVSGFTGIFGGFCWYFGDFHVDPNNADQVYAMGVDLVRSTDGGANFTSVLGNSHVDHHALWIDPSNSNHIYLGNDGGFWSTTAGGTSWTHAVTLDIWQFYGGAIDPSNPARLMGGTQDNNTVITSGSPTAWTPILGGDGFQCLIDPTNANVIIAEFQYCCSGGGPRRSINGGSSFASPTGIISTDRWNWSTPLAMNPKDHNVILVGSQRVYQSTNNGVAYATISGDLTTNTPSQLVYSTITTLEVAPADTNVYYAGTDDGKVWRSINHGGAWTDISAGLPIRWVTRVVGDPLDPQAVFVTLSGFSGDEHAAHVFRSPDRGNTWTAISGNLPDAPVNDIVVDPLDTQRDYVATDIGVYWTSDGGSIWVPLGQGLPFTAVFDLNLHAPSRTLIAATHGRSQWKLDLTQAPVAAPAPALPVRLALSRPWPNPGRGVVRMTLELPAASAIDVAIYDASGRRMRTLLGGSSDAGTHALAWDGADDRGAAAAPGVYFLRARTGAASVTRRIVRVD
ncbi:MAG: T9SS type A sorting domain-containing protein [Candidatus Eisenbacteria bacterium]|uniref:T9SS type A sorting domain-containing protein n=1 Tax=Eiseniibacteriota bacterium TaxID=2212470 RepID=A0A9D6L9V7_UNCEI|nr:T9SS type A sorting domain-containing protein [Candidatus Eisenbacteria bacterium]MBI3540270.1 T9SS type A sorting domain-containing protein [Candidatus Eisenbacteria bacterium]